MTEYDINIIFLSKGSLDNQLRYGWGPIHHQAEHVFRNIKNVRNLIQALPPALPYAVISALARDTWVYSQRLSHFKGLKCSFYQVRYCLRKCYFLKLRSVSSIIPFHFKVSTSLLSLEFWFSPIIWTVTSATHFLFWNHSLCLTMKSPKLSRQAEGLKSLEAWEKIKWNKISLTR